MRGGNRVQTTLPPAAALRYDHATRVAVIPGTVPAQDGVLLEEVTLADNARRTLPVGGARTPSGNWLDADGAYFDRHFAWVTDGSGSFRVARRNDAGAAR